MRTLWKCCIRALKENRSRTIVTIIGVAMATVLITTLACIGTSFLTTVIQFLKATEGTAHEHYLGVKQENLKYFLNNQSIEELWLKKTNAYYHIDFQDDQRNQFVLGISNATDGWFAAHGQKLVEGRMPERDGEIVLEKNVRTHLGYDLQVGDKIAAYSESGDKTFELVGFFEDEHLGFHFVDEYYLYHMEYYVEGNPREHYQVYFTIDAYTYGDVDTTEAGEYYVSLRYTKAALYHRDEIAAALMGISNELYEKAYKNPYVHTIRFSKEEEKQLRSRVITFEPNSALEAFEGLSPFHLTQATVWVIAFSEVIFLFFVLAGVFCINNSFDVSITERVRFYGMISSIGSSKRQRRMLVWMEAFVIGLYGIPLGLMLGIGLSFGLVELANLSLKLLMPSLRFAFTFRVAWWAILIAVLQAIFMIALSAMEAAMHAAKITPMEAIRSNDTVRSKGKKKRTPGLIKKLFGVGGGIAWQNYKRAKVKYRATIISISVSVAFLLAMLFVPFFFRFLERELQGQYGGMDCQVEIIVNHESGYDQLSEIRRFPEVTKGQIIRDSVIVYKEREQLEDGTYTAQPAFFILAIDDETFDWLCKENGIDPEKARGKGLISKKEETLKVGEIYAGEQNIYKFLKVGEPGVPTEVEIVGKVDTERLWGYYDYKMDVIVGESYVKVHPKLFDGAATGYFTCTDANAFYDAVEKQNLVGLNMVNFDQIYQITRLVKIIVYLFMIGFLFLVATIGTTNVINAVNSNMEMRASEFAKLRAVGMTRKQFQGMILTEGGFIAAKGLFWGYLFGCGIYYVLHSMFAKSADILFTDPMYRMSLRFRLPIGYMLASGLVVVGLIYCVLKLHVKRAEKRNVIETIRNENL